MLARIRKSMQERDQGFTLIELLVVMIIIGILAAIAIPTFLSQRENGYRSALQTDLRNAAVALESYAVSTGGSYADLNGVTLSENGVITAAALTAGDGDLEFNGSEYIDVVVTSADATTFVLTARHDLLEDEEWTFDKAVGVPDEVEAPAAD